MVKRRRCGVSVLELIQQLSGDTRRPSTNGWIAIRCRWHRDRDRGRHAGAHSGRGLFRCFAEGCAAFGTRDLNALERDLFPYAFPQVDGRLYPNRRSREYRECPGITTHIQRGVCEGRSGKRPARAHVTHDGSPSAAARAAFSEIRNVEKYVSLFLREHPQSHRLRDMDRDDLVGAALEAMIEKYPSWRPDLHGGVKLSTYARAHIARALNDAVNVYLAEPLDEEAIQSPTSPAVTPITSSGSATRAASSVVISSPASRRSSAPRGANAGTIATSTTPRRLRPRRLPRRSQSSHLSSTVTLTSTGGTLSVDFSRRR
jgi:hypothetical protein